MRKTFAVRRQSVFLVARHFAEGPRMTVRLAIGQKHRIITEALFAARRPDQNAVDPRLEFFEMSVRPGDGESRDEMGATLARCGGAALVELLLDRGHGGGKVLIGAGPARRIDPGFAIKCVDNDARIVGKS